MGDMATGNKNVNGRRDEKLLTEFVHGQRGNGQQTC